MSAATAIVRARSALITSAPFFGTLALHLEPAERPDLTKTMATDGRHLYYSADFVGGLSEPELMGVIAHEVMHCAYGHHVRIGARDLKTFNEAADYAVNRDLLAACFVLPRGMLLNPAFDGMGAEEIYSLLQQRQAKQQQAANQQGGQGTGQQQSGTSKPSSSTNGQQAQGSQPGANGQPQGGTPAAGGAGRSGDGSGPGQGDAAAHGIGGIIAPASVADAAAEAGRWQVIARQAVNVAKAHAGSVPGWLETLVAEIKSRAADFRELLADWIDSRVAFDYSFARPNRRMIHTGFYLPGAVVDGLEHVVFAVDTSGSITADMLDNAAAEIVGAMESGKFRRLTVLMADTRVCDVAEFDAGDDVKLTLKGGGGTDFRDTFEWIAEHAGDASAVVYLTDLQVSEFGQDPGCPVLWATHGDSRAFASLARAVPFGEAVYVGRL